MRAIIIGAGRGRRLGSLTDAQPKCFAPIGGRRILDWILEALSEAGLGAPVFVGGWQIDRIRAEYPGMAFRRNAGWESNNILASLFCAEEDMADGFVSTYADILYRGDVVRRALAHPGDIVLGVDTDWRSRYAGRSLHPEGDAEKLAAEGDRVRRIHRAIPSEEATGEFIGVAKFSPHGASLLREHYRRAKTAHAGKPWRGAAVFEKSYLIALLDEMLESGVPIHQVTTPGEYMEIDTEEDFSLANARWLPERFPRGGVPA